MARQDYMQKEWLLAQVQPCKAGEKKKKKIGCPGNGPAPLPFFLNDRRLGGSHERGLKGPPGFGLPLLSSSKF